MTRTDTTFDQDRRIEGYCVCMCTVQCRVTVDNTYEFEHPFSHGDCNFDARLLSKTRKYQQTDISEIRQNDFRSPTQVQNANKRKTRSHLAECDSFKTRQFCQPILVRPIQCVNSVKHVSFNLSKASKRPTALVYEHSQVVCYVRTHQIRHLLVVGSPSNRRGAISQCLLVYSFHIACFSSSLSRHGPFVVRSAQLFHRSDGVIPLSHPS